MLLAAVCFLALTVALLWPRKGAPVAVHGNYSTADIKAIRRAAMKDMHFWLLKEFGCNLVHLNFKTAMADVKSYARVKVERINAEPSGVASAMCGSAPSGGIVYTFAEHQTNGWHGMGSVMRVVY